MEIVKANTEQLPITYIQAGLPLEITGQNTLLPLISFFACLSWSGHDDWTNAKSQIILAEGCMPPTIGGVLTLMEVMGHDDVTILPGRPERRLLELLGDEGEDASRWRTQVQEQCQCQQEIDWQGMYAYLESRMGQCAIDLTKSFGESMQVRSSQYEPRMKIGESAWVIHMLPDSRVNRATHRGLYIGMRGGLYKVHDGAVYKYHQSEPDDWEKILPIT
jgi:hypothetical protein